MKERNRTFDKFQSGKIWIDFFLNLNSFSNLVNRWKLSSVDNAARKPALNDRSMYSIYKQLDCHTSARPLFRKSSKSPLEIGYRFVLLPNPLPVCTLTQSPSGLYSYPISFRFVLLPNLHPVCTLTQFPSCLYSYPISFRFVLLPNLLPVCFC